MHLHNGESRLFRRWCTGAAWLSSARVVRCWVKSRNERNPCPVLSCVTGDCRCWTPEEGGDDVKSAWPLRLGRHTRYNGRGSALPGGNTALIARTSRSADWRLQLAAMKPELLVTA